MTASRQSAHLLVVGLALALLAVLLAAPPAPAGPFAPTQKQAQRILARAYDRELRPRYGQRAGIRTRCRGRRVVMCSVRVWKNGELRYWQVTEARLTKGSVLTDLDGALRGIVAIPHPGGSVTFYRSEPLEPSDA